MDDEDDFLRMIAANLEDDAPRLVFADWLEERGDARGEFIRVQCALAAMRPDDPSRPGLVARVQDLLAAHYSEWQRSSYGPFERGFREGELVWRGCTRDIVTSDDLRAATSAHRAVLFIDALWSGDARSARPVARELVRAWVRGKIPPPVSFYRVDIDHLDLMDDLRRWLTPQLVPEDVIGLTYSGCGPLLWIRNGSLVDYVHSPACLDGPAGDWVGALVERTRLALDQTVIGPCRRPPLAVEGGSGQ